MELKELSSEKRSLNPYHHIDPGFINYRKCNSIFGSEFVNLFDKYRNKGDDHWSKLKNDHIFVDLALEFCRKNQVETLGECLSNIKEGQIFCSTEKLKGNEDVYEKDRIKNKVILPYSYDKDVFLEFGTRHIVADTGRLEQSQESVVSIIGEIRRVKENKIIIYPLIMGAPTFDHIENKEIDVNLMWHGWDWYETFPEDINEFSNIKSISDPSPEEWMDYMKDTPEQEIKEKLCDILNDVPKKDWGGEQDDHFTTSIHLNDKRISTAFLLKGPSAFKEMTPEVLGKRADQIYRLANTPAQLLVVQHCHDIGEAVRATLRAFSVSPHNPRRYCLIDGKDTYKILTAYNKL